MSLSAFFRMSSVALMIGGLVGAVAVAFHPSNMTDPVNVPVHFALYLAVMVALLGLPGLGARIAPRTGALGLGGMILLFLGLAFEDPIHSVLEFTVIQRIAADPAARSILSGSPPGLLGPVQMLAVPVIFGGLILLAISIWRTEVLPRWLAVPLIATVLLIPLGFAVPMLRSAGPGLLYLSLAALGWALGTEDQRAVDSLTTLRHTVMS